MRRILAFLTLTLLLLATGVTISKAQSCNNEDECKKLINEYEQKLVGIRDQKSTLSSQIQFADTQIYLTTLRIQDAERKIEQTADEIENLKGRIVTLNSSLDHISKLLLEKIIEGYKRREVPLFSIFIDPDNASTMFNRLKYAKVAEENDRKLGFQVQQAKLNFEQQKGLREQKQTELAQLSNALEQQKAALDSQKLQKQRLLADTQNDERTYQNLIARARAQSSAFSSFARSSGAYSSISPDGLGTGSDGNYFSQRDSRWASQILGNSSSDCDGHGCSVLEAGCLASSIAMVARKQGNGGINPAAIASNLDYFSANTAYMKYGTPAGSRQSISVSDVDSQLSQGRYVIAGINHGGCSSNSDHFVVLTKKEGSEYKMHDPIYGPDINFSSHYSQICYAELLN